MSQLNRRFSPKHCVLRVTPMPGSHTAESINFNFLDIIEDFNISRFKIQTNASDNAANMLKGVNDTGLDSLPCFLHTLQLEIHECVFDPNSVSTILIVGKLLAIFHTHLKPMISFIPYKKSMTCPITSCSKMSRRGGTHLCLWLHASWSRNKLL